MSAPRLFDPDAPELLGPGGRALTAEQENAVRARSGERLLSATAGSGKTSVLVERFVRAVLEDEVEAGRILAITFTDKAARELRARIRERFLELGERGAARAAEAAPVSTIHAFCARVLRGHALAAGLDPRFRILDEPEARRLEHEAFDDALAGWLDEAAAAGPGRLELAAAYKPDPLRETIREVHGQLRTRGNTRPQLPLRAAPALDEARARVQRALEAAAGVVGAALPGGARVRAAADALRHCRELLDRCAGGEPPLPDDVAAGSFSAQAGALQIPEIDEYLAAVAAWRQGCADVLAADALGLLDGLLGRFADEYAARKRARSAVDYEDLELQTVGLLRGDPGLRAAVAGGFDAIMVDEFQDTNPLQVSLLELLDRDDTMVVGDEFQSIYGFRHADVGLFRERRARLAARGEAGELSLSFRARRELVDAIDAIFVPRFGAQFVPLRAADSAPPCDGEPRVELLVTGEEGWEERHPGVGDGLPPARPARYAEARLLAQRVRELVDAGEVEPEEVAVLLRAATDIAVFERALRDAGLAATVTGGRGYWEGQQVRDLCAHLGAVANARDERRLFEVLASPLAGLSSDGLAVLARVRRELRRDAWWTLEQAFRPAGDGSDELATRLSWGDRALLEQWVPWLADERVQAPLHGPARLIERAVRATGYDRHVLSLPGGERRLANVRKLQRLAREHEAVAGADLRGFLEFVDLQQQLAPREPEAPVEGEGVQLMSIHAAKGLEWDVVCVADLGRVVPKDAPVVRVGDDGRVGLRVASLEGERAKALDYEALEVQAKAREAAEEERVLYVALSRARHRLILSGAVCNTKWPPPNPRGAPISWLAPSIDPDVATLTADEPVRELRRSVERWTLHATVSLNTPDTVGRVLRPESLAPDRGAGAEAGGAPEPGHSPTAPVAPAAPAAAPPPTLSYSSLGDYDRCPYRYYLERVLRLPREEQRWVAPAEGGGLGALERGSIVHAVLERVDFAGEPPGAAEIAAVAGALGEQPSGEELDDLGRLTGALLASPLATRLAGAGEVRREAGFAFLLDLGAEEPTLITGVVDAIGREGEGAMVVDYKSDRLAPEDDAETLVAHDYPVQRIVYALAALHEGAQHVEVIHCFLERANEPAVARFAASDAPALEAELRELARGVVAGRFPVTATPHAGLCLGCPGRSALCSWPEEMTGRPPELAPEGARVKRDG